LPNVAVTAAVEAEVSTVEAVLAVAAFTAVVTVADIVAAVTATVAGIWARCMAAADTAAVTRDAATEAVEEAGPRDAAMEAVDEAGRRGETLRAAIGRAGVETEGTFRVPLPTDSGIRSEVAEAGSRRDEWVASADQLTGVEVITAGAALAGVAGMAVGEGVGAAAGGLALASV
jgi:hypothetical protein